MMGNRVETEAEGIPRSLYKTRTTSSTLVTITPVVTSGTTSQTRTKSSARTFGEQICQLRDKDCESPTQIRRDATAEYEKFIAGARRIHLEKLTKVKDDAIVKVVSRTDADTTSRTKRWMDVWLNPPEITKAKVDIMWDSID